MKYSADDIERMRAACQAREFKTLVQGQASDFVLGEFAAAVRSEERLRSCIAASLLPDEIEAQTDKWAATVFGSMEQRRAKGVVSLTREERSALDWLDMRRAARPK